MNPNRITVKFFLTDPERAVELAPFIELFHRFIQNGTLEGLLLDVADYAHVPDGPGVMLIGHDIDHAIDLMGGGAGLLTVRKRCRDLSLDASLRDAVRRAVVVMKAVEQEESVDLVFDPRRFEVQVFDRSESPNDDTTFEAAKKLAAPVLEKVYTAGFEVERGGSDGRSALTLEISTDEPITLETLIERLGATLPVSPPKARQSVWDISPEGLKELRESGTEHVLVDVRNADEVAQASLGGRHIPLDELEGRKGELAPDAHIVVHCDTGVRSARAVQTLRDAGYENAWSLLGGLRAWIQRIDPSLGK